MNHPLHADQIHPLTFPFKKPSSLKSASSQLCSQQSFPLSLEKKLTDFISSHKLSALTILLGTFQLLLFRYCREHHFLAGLLNKEQISLIDLYCDDTDSFLTLISRLKKTLNKSHSHSLLPSSSRYQVCFSYMTNALNKVHHQSVNLIFSIQQDGDRASLSIRANHQMFHLNTIEKMINHYFQLLKNSLEDPQKKINVLSYLTDEEINLVTTKFNSTTYDSYPDHVIEFFEKKVKINPNAIAIRYREQSITFVTLNQRANKIANYLRCQGADRETVIALSSLYDDIAIASILAIIKLGATYLPIDPSYPVKRLEMMLDDADPTIVLTRFTFIEKFKSFSKKVIDLDQEWGEISKAEEDCVSIQPNLSSSAYIIYTSGSTGIPKGIKISYESLPHLCFERKNIYPKKIISLLLGSISFDVSLLTVLHTLMLGGILSIPNPKEYVDGEALIKHIKKEQINFFICVPSFYNMLLKKGRPLSSSLEMISLAGEMIPHSLIKRHAQLAPQVKLINEYGPSEVALGSTFAEIYNPTNATIHPITAGRPLPNTEIYILDPYLQLVPVGMKGEICIGGMGLAKGYLNKSELTMQQFVTVNLTGNRFIRLYRTGDFGRFCIDGNLEFLGRMDNQVKIRGHRVELGEVESVLSQYQGIDEVIVTMQNHPAVLIAYFTSTKKQIISPKELRQYLSELLPHFSVPAHFVSLKQFSRTPNGKIDREALPKQPTLQTNEKAIDPQVNIQETLLKIWKNVLNLKEIDLNENFFDVGGNSLLLANVQTEINNVFCVNISMMACFRYPTIHTFAKYLESVKNQNSSSLDLQNHTQESCPNA